MKRIDRWCSQFGIPSQLRAGDSDWRLTAVHGDARGARMRFTDGRNEVVVRMEPRTPEAAAYAVSESIALSHGPLPTSARTQALSLVADISARVVATDDGRLGDAVAQLRRSFSDGDADYVRTVLRRLPHADSARARAFIDAVVAAVDAEDVPAWVVEPSFRPKDRAFRMSLNTTLVNAGERSNRASVGRAVQSWRRLCLGAGLPAVVPEAQVRKWVTKDDHHAYVGVAFGADDARCKLYFHAPESAFLSFAAILPVLGFNSAQLGDAHMICADYDLLASRFVALKTYTHAGKNEVRCVRRAKNGLAIDRSTHRDLRMTPDEVKAWFSERGDPGLGSVVATLVDDEVLKVRVVSDGPLPTMYTAIVRETLPPVDGA